MWFLEGKHKSLSYTGHRHFVSGKMYKWKLLFYSKLYTMYGYNEWSYYQ